MFYQGPAASGLSAKLPASFPPEKKSRFQLRTMPLGNKGWVGSPLHHIIKHLRDPGQVAQGAIQFLPHLLEKFSPGGSHVGYGSGVKGEGLL